MTTQEVANRLVELCRTGQNASAYDEIFADNAVAIEPAHTGQPATEGIAALKAKTAQYMGSVKEMHSAYCSDAIVAGNHFSCTMGMDVTFQDGNRIKMDEVCVYEVKDGKIVKEQFFF